VNNPVDPQRLRNQGVRFPEQQSTEAAPAMKVTNVLTGQVALVEYGDERGNKVTQLAFIFNGKVFVQPDNGRWTSTFKPLNTKLAAQVMDLLSEQLPPAALDEKGSVVPPEDAVDVTAPGPGEGG
jgi:hypothetical protein